MDILGVRVDNFTREEILLKISQFLDEPRFHQVATVNPEFILEAQINPAFKKVLNDCELNVADGFGVRCAFWRSGKHLKCRLTGADILGEILELAKKKKISIFLACRKNGLSSYEETKKAIHKIHPDLTIDGEDICCHSCENEDAISRLRVSAPDFRLREDNKMIVFCNFGAPHQELFIDSAKCDRIRLAMGVGGSFDYLTGKIRRAPVFWRQIGLEWLWRLVLQPRRWKGIFRAVVIFPIRVILGK